MIAPSLSVLGLGTYLTAGRLTEQVATELGADTTGFRGWETVRIASDDEHPSTMGAQALTVALENAGVSATELSLVISASMSRDYLPSWSVSTEVMKLVGAPRGALGLDLTSGCLGTLAALDMASAWLAHRGGGYAAVVATERWAYTVDRASRRTMSLWGHSDGGGAIVIGHRGEGHVGLDYLGAEFATNSELNGRVLIRYGGTRFPVAQAGADANFREVSSEPAREVREKYREGYTEVLDRLGKRFGRRPTRLVCNQITPGVVAMIAEAAGVPLERTTVTGHRAGHLGTGDVVYGLDALVRDGDIDGPVAIAASTPYAFGAGLLVPSSEAAMKRSDCV